MKTLLPLIFGFLMILSTNAQVGVNNPNPEQALDVNGKVKITDDSNDPTAGTMRYNDSESDFEGFNGVDWKSFTQARNGIPSNAQFVTGRVGGLPLQSSPSTNIIFIDHNNVALINPLVPAGKYLLITGISIAPSNLFDIDIEDPFYHFQLNLGSTILEISGKYTGGTLYQNNAGYAPIAIVRSGVSASIFNYQLVSSFEQFDGGVDVLVTGFLVDDLNFN